MSQEFTIAQRYALAACRTLLFLSYNLAGNSELIWRLQNLSTADNELQPTRHICEELLKELGYATHVDDKSTILGLADTVAMYHFVPEVQFELLDPTAENGMATFRFGTLTSRNDGSIYKISLPVATAEQLDELQTESFVLQDSFRLWLQEQQWRFCRTHSDRRQ